MTSVPAWVQDAIFYQIFPDRFANGDPANDPPNIQPWGSKPTHRGFLGGDLRGVIQRFDYLLDLGINALYFNPIFISASNHRYHINDYYQIDPLVGNLDDFKALVEVAHANDVRIILDGVFNHSGRGFFAFNSILESKEESPYRDWYHVNSFPVDAFSPGPAKDYLAWWNIKDLPKFNTGNPYVRRYIFDVAQYWLEQGADGWRLDVPGEIDDDVFWAEFRSVVKRVNRDAYIVGEIWEADPRWVDKNHFDGLMNYPLRASLLDFLKGELTADLLAENLDQLMGLYNRENYYAMYVPLGSHDTKRLANKLGGDVDKVKQAFTFQFAYPGAPAIYYGDEIGMSGGKDPDNRKAFPWDDTQWDHDLRSFVQKLIALRKAHPVLRRGDYKRLMVHTIDKRFAFTRTLGSTSVIVALNTSRKDQKITLRVKTLGWNPGHPVRDLLSGEKYIVTEDGLTLLLSANAVVWLLGESQ